MLVTIDNYKLYVNKTVEVEITCYEFGLMYPDNNILVGMNEDYFYFVSDKGTEDELYWHWEAKDTERGFGKPHICIQVFAI